MKVSKTKYAVEFTEEEKKAIAIISNIADSLYEEDLCTTLKCENCPLYHSFCMSCDTDEEKANSVKQRIEKFLNGTD
jgi:hypothetical protein